MQWKIAATLPGLQGTQSLGFAGPVSGVCNQIFIVAGGANFPGSPPWQGGKKKFYNEVFLYACKGDTLQLLNQQATLPYPISYPACCTTAKGVFYAGGENENGISAKAWLIQWDNETQKIIFNNLPDLPVPVTNAAATVIENIVYVAGGETTMQATAQWQCLDLNNTKDGWKQLADIPHAVSNMVLAATDDDQIILAGGRKKNKNGISDLYAEVYAYSPSHNKWESKAPLPYALSAATGISYKNGKLLVFGGDQGTTFHQVETTLAAIFTEEDEIKKQELIRKKNTLLSQHPGFSKEILRYSLASNTWKATGKIPFNTPVTTVAVKYGNCVMIPSGEIKAGVRSPYILELRLK